jgi:hypothetical protein
MVAVIVFEKMSGKIEKFLDLIEPCVRSAVSHGVSQSDCYDAIVGAVPKLATNELLARFMPVLYARRAADGATSAVAFADALTELQSACKGRAIPRHFPALSTILAYIDRTFSEIPDNQLESLVAPDPECGTTVHREPILCAASCHCRRK